MHGSRRPQHEEVLYASAKRSHSSAKAGKRRSSVYDRTMASPDSYAETFDEESDDETQSQSYLAIGSNEPSDEQLRKALSMMMMGDGRESVKSFAPSTKDRAAEKLVKSVVACQNCSEVSARSKQLQCSHTICCKCAIALRSKHLDPGQWMLRCLVCNLVTTWYGKKLEGLQDMAVQKAAKQPSGVQMGSGIVRTKEGQITMYGEKDLTINIVSFAKEKAEIQKARENAEKKIQICQRQAKHIKEHEKRVNDAKAKLRKQLKRAADNFIAAIRSQQAQMTEDLEELFKADMQPVQSAKASMDAQTHSLKLVTQCCNVANKILKNGGAPLDLDNFKRMVWQTMNRTNVEQLPKAIPKNYKPSIFFKSNESQFDEIAEKIGELVVRKVEEAGGKKASSVKSSAQKPPPSPSSSEEEQLYDLPPEVDTKMDRIASRGPGESIIYDEIPFSSEMLDDEESTEETPPPIPKSLHFMAHLEEDTDNLPPPPTLTSDMIANDMGIDPTNYGIEEAHQEQEDDRDFDFDGDSSFSSDVDEQAISRPVPATRSRINSVRSPGSGYKSARESRSRPGSPTIAQRQKSFADASDLSREFGGGKYASKVSGYDTHPEQKGTISRLIRRRKSLKSLGHLTSHLQQWLGNADDTPVVMNAEKLLFCIGKVKKPGSGGGSVVQPFHAQPEFTISEDDTVWIADSTSSRIQLHEGVNGRIVGSFKTALQGVALKPRGITTLANARQVAVSCGRFVTVWTEGGELIRQVGPHSDFGKLGGIGKDSGGNLILCDVENSRIVFTDTGKIIYDAVMSVNNSGKAPWFGRIAVNSYDQIICPDYGTHCIRIYDSGGHLINKFGGFGVGPRQFRYPSAVAVDAHDRIFVADECNNRISMFTDDGSGCLGHVITKEDGLAFPHAVHVFSDGAIAVADDNKVIKIYKGSE